MGIKDYERNLVLKYYGFLHKYIKNDMELQDISLLGVAYLYAAPATFVRLMDDILRSFTNSFMMVYLGDIIIFSHSWEEHLHHIRQVLQTLRQHKLCANLEKCTFGMTQVQYIGYIINEQGVHVYP